MKAKIENLLRAAHKLEASDIHLTVGAQPIMRINGKLRKVGDARLTPADTEEMARTVFSTKLWEDLNENGEVDFSYGIAGVSRFRINAYYQRSCVAIAVRVIPNKIPSIEDLQLPPIIKRIAKSPQGLILVTGPTGSGKSTTLASMIQLMNRTMSKRIITLEDPIEYLHNHHKSIIDQREIGFDTQSFANGLRSALRQDPDVILVGEMRDLETIQTAITAAETGHLVLATLHTVNAPAAIHRMIDVFPSYQQQQIRYQLAETLVSVIAQRLFPSLVGNGRRAATEILINTPAISNLIRIEKIYQIANVMQTSREQGMHTLEASIQELVTNNSILKEDADSFLRGKKK